MMKNHVPGPFPRYATHISSSLQLIFLCVLVFTYLPTCDLHAQCSLHGYTSTYVQPGGQKIELVFHGNELYARTETTDGYTVVFDTKSKTYHYAVLDASQENLLPSGHIVGKANPARLGYKKGLRIKASARRAKALARHKKLEAIRQDKKATLEARKQVRAYREYKKTTTSSGTTTQQSSSDSTTTSGAPEAAPAPPVNPPTLGDIVGLTILVDFPDVPARSDITPADIDDYCNKPGGNWANNGSIYDYFYTQSSGRMRYTNNVTYYVRVPHPFSYYNDTALGSGTCGRTLITDAVNQLKADGYDFSGLTVNASNRVIATNLFWAGNNSGVWAKGLWPHRSGVGPLDLGNGTFVYDYQMTQLGTSGYPGIGTFCHENGHLVGKYPDYYDVAGGEGVGKYCLMGSGNHATQQNPVNISAYLKYHSGWLDVIDLNSLSTPIRLAHDVDSNIAYKYTNTDPAWTNEYFIVENRSKIGGWEAGSGLPDSGLLISHAHETGSSSTNVADADLMTEALHYEHSIEQADGLFQLEGQGAWGTSRNRGNNTDLFHSGGTGPKTEFSDSTTPNAKWWKGATGASGSPNGTNSGLHIHSISAAASTMTFVYGTGTPSGNATTQLTRSIFENATDLGGTAPSQRFCVYNSGGGTVNYTITDNVTWLSCSPASGAATTETDPITVTYSTSALSAGTYNGTITVDGGTAGTQTIAVTLTVRSQPTIAAAPVSLSEFGISGTSGPESKFSITNTGGGTLPYTVSKTQAWLSLSRTSGTVATERDDVTVFFDATSLSAGVYNDTITVSAPGSSNGSVTVAVEFVVQSSNMVVAGPNGGEAYYAGTTSPITWTSDLGPGTVKIELLKGGALDSVITASTANDGSFDWPIPDAQTPGSDYRVRISSIDTPAAIDTSNGDFTINGTPAFVTIPYYESFESNSIGDWTQSTTDDMDWTVSSNGTGSTGTGPTAAQDGTYYIYTEASSPNYPSKNAVLTLWFDLRTANAPELSFYYHMYATDTGMGTLTVEASTNGVDYSPVFTQTGNLGDVWNLATVDLSAYAGALTQLRIHGQTGSNFTSDMAVDNISVVETSTGPEMAVDRGASPIADGGTDALATSEAGVGSQLTYTISNNGTGGLTLTTPISATAVSNCSIAVDTQPSGTVSASTSTNLVLTVTPTSNGAWSATVSIDNNDADENPYNWTISGTAETLYTVTLNKQGGTGGTNSVQAALGSAMPAASAPNRAGYAFGGYYTGTNGSGTQYYTAAMASAKNWDIAADTTLYAKWTIKTYTVTLNKQGGTGGTNSVTTTWGTAMPAASAPTRTGYAFGGYYTGTNGSGTQYYTAAMASAQNWDIDSDTTLYAKWTGTDPEMDVTRGGAIADGSTDSVSGTSSGSGTQLTYVVESNGTANITVANAVISGETNCAVVVNTQPTSPVAPTNSTTLVVTVTPAAAGFWSFSVSMATNDPDENPYDWTVNGSAASTSTLTGTDDTYINSASTGTNYGADTVITVRDPSSERYGLIRFDLSSIPAGSTITNASLNFYATGSGYTGPIDIYNTNTTSIWNVGTATWANSSGLVGNTQFGTADLSDTTAGAAVPTIALNASGIAAVQGWVDGSSNNGFSIKTTFTHGNAGRVVEVCSFDHGTAAYRPTLTVEYTVPANPEITILGNGTEIVDGDVTPSLADDTDFGDVATNSAKDVTFTIANDGSADLTLSGAPKAAISGSAAFTVQTQPSSPVSPAGSTTVVVRFLPTTSGVQTATVSIANNDADENPYTFDVKGNGTTTGTPIADVSLRNGLTIIGYTGENPIDAEVAFGDLITAGQLINVRWIDPANGFTKELYESPVFGWVNDIGNLTLGEGYIVRTNAQCTLSISGNKSTAGVTHNLRVLSIIGFNMETPMDAQTAFAELITAGKLLNVRWIDANGFTQELYESPVFGWVNDIGNLLEGQGYIIKLNATHDGFAFP